MPKRKSTFARILRSARESAGLSVAQLADKAGLSRQAVYALENGAWEPTWETVKALADALGIKTDELR